MTVSQMGLPGIDRYPAVPSAKLKTGASAEAAVKSRHKKDDAYTHILYLLRTWDSTPTECAKEAASRGGDITKAILYYRPRVSELKQTILESTGERRDGGDVLRIRPDLRLMTIRELIAEHYRRAKS